MEPQKHQYIDSLRGVAILLVLMVHNLYLGAGSEYFPKFLFQVFDDGQFGVQLFFVVSAYTLMASFYSRSSEQHATRKFFIRRFFRIAPMYYLAIIYFTFQSIIGFNYFATGHVLQHVSYGKMLSNLSFTHGISPHWMNTLVPGGWSIAVEMSFYLLLPLFCRIIKNINSALLLVIASLLFSTLLESFLNTTWLNANQYLYYYFPSQLPVFGLGMVAFFIINKPQVQIKPYLLLLTAATFLFYRYAAFNYHIPFSIAFCVLLIALAKRPYKILVNGFFSQVGKISFSMYLVHFVVMHWMVYLGINNLLTATDFSSALLGYFCRLSILSVLSFIISSVTYKFIELRFQKTSASLIVGWPLLQKKTPVLNPVVATQAALKKLYRSTR